MARTARYRPCAPSDGLGNLTAAPEQLDLAAEAAAYAVSWWSQEENDTFVIGCCNFDTRPATIYAIEAARCLCGVEDDTALRLLQMAVADLTAREARP